MNNTRKTPVRWSDADIEKVWAALPDVIEKNRRRGLTWQVEHAGQIALGPDRWRRIPSFATIPSSLLSKIADRYPELKRIYHQLEHVNQLPIDKETFINLVVETRLSQPFTDFVDIWNECIALVPELDLPEVSHAKYIDPDLSNLIQRQCEAWLEPEPETEAEQSQPKLEEYTSIDLLNAYHGALVREMHYAFESKQSVVSTNGSTPAPAAFIETVAASAPSPIQPITRQKILKGLGDLESKEEPKEDGKPKIRITIVDHNVSRTPTEFEREYPDTPAYKLKFFFTIMGSKESPSFKQGGYAILSESAMVSWKNDAIRVCGRQNVFITNGSRESIREAMQRVISLINVRTSASSKPGVVLNGKH